MWTLSGNHARNGELWLTDGDYRTRVLHALSDKDVPPPGYNEARRAFYSNVPLPLDLPEPLIGPPNDQLLVLWRIDPETGIPVFRVVRPVGVWSFGGYAKVDLDFVLPPTAADLERLHFEPTDQGLELPIPNEEDGNADGAGGIPG